MKIAAPKHRLPNLLLIAGVIIYIITFSVLSAARYKAFHASTLDLGIMTQVVWNTAHGRWFETSIGRATNVELIGSYLGNHVRPILALLAPLYRLWPDPRLLLILQSIALGIAAFPLHWIAQAQTKDRKAAFIVVCCYLAYPALGFLNLVDFHPIAFSIPFIFLAYWALGQERMALFWIAVLLALFTKEEMVVPIGTWGLINILKRKRRRVGLSLVILAGVWAALCFGLIIPAFNERQPYRFWQLWSHLAIFPSQANTRGGAAQPIPSASPETIILFLLHLFLPLGFLPFLGFTSFTVALPSLSYLLLGKRPALHSVGYQYPAVLIPWFFLATVEGLRRTRRAADRFGKLRLYRLGLAFLLIGTIGSHIPLNPILIYARAGIFHPDPYHGEIVEAMEKIPPTAGVATISRLGPPLANRRVLVALEYPPPFRPDHLQAANYVLLDMVDCRLVPTPDPRVGYADIVEQILQTRSFRVRYWSERILLLEKGTPTDEEIQSVRDYVNRLVERDRPCWP